MKPTALLIVPSLLAVSVVHAESPSLSTLRSNELERVVKDRRVKSGPDEDRETYLSPDRKFETGLYSSGPIHEVINGPEGYANHEMIYLLAGQITMTATDGTRTVFGPGQSVTIPKGWTGTFESGSYVKLYSIYYPDGLQP
ncbi:cupin domain-containing protein [Rhizobium sp. S163]|uniref:cupin domain-containing protein n=1 Tax=Rhizobium sp. S163 TaxID=3055039 RepID=UPI0025A9F924|nr:cupin domain-containing protein [Rhizobium sp. S163]MDM9648353.1 cupin domain-containing protein [Rhizobium sp. S163]